MYKNISVKNELQSAKHKIYLMVPNVKKMNKIAIALISGNSAN